MYRPPIAQRIALLHPAILTIAWVLLNSVPLAALDRPLVQGAFTALFAGLMCGWSWAVFTVSLARRPAPEIPQWTPWIFLAPPAITLLAAVIGLPTRNSPVALLFFALWRAAEALEWAANVGTPPTVGRILGTMMLMFFMIAGVWVLRQKVVRVSG
jgi:hypothetical protein